IVVDESRHQFQSVALVEPRVEQHSAKARQRDRDHGSKQADPLENLLFAARQLGVAPDSKDLTAGTSQEIFDKRSLVHVVFDEKDLSHGNSPFFVVANLYGDGPIRYRLSIAFFAT